MRAIVVGVVGLAACGGAGRGEVKVPEAAKADYVAVHVDTLAADKVGQFVAARQAWVAALDAAHAVDGRGTFLAVGDHAFYTLRPFARFGDFDTRGEAIERAMAAVPKAAGDAYDRGSDTSLVFPHASEVWQVDADLSYAPPAGALDLAHAAAGRLVIDDVRPDPADEDRYWSAVGEEDQALAAARYPLTRVGYRTTFGAGHVYTLWLARSQAELDAAPPVEAAVAGVRGAARAAALEAQIAGAVERRQVEPVVVRADLTRLVPR